MKITLEIVQMGNTPKVRSTKFSRLLLSEAILMRTKRQLQMNETNVEGRIYPKSTVFHII